MEIVDTKTFVPSGSPERDPEVACEPACFIPQGPLRETLRGHKFLKLRKS